MSEPIQTVEIIIRAGSKTHRARLDGAGNPIFGDRDQVLSLLTDWLQTAAAGDESQAPDDEPTTPRAEPDLDD